MNRSTASLAILLAATLVSASAAAQPTGVEAPVIAGPSYADLAGLAERAPLVIKAEIRRQARVKQERAPGLAPGFARLYVEARTEALISGTVPVGEELRYLVDVPLTDRGRAPRLKGESVILFARPVPGRPGEIQLVDTGAQRPAGPALEARLRPILAELVAPDAPPAITGVAEALRVRGTLVGESETQLFLDTENDGPVSVTVVRRPGQAPRWGVSWTEIVDQSAAAPQRDTLAWYRLACSLPRTLPADALITNDADARELANRDYAFVIEQLGPCTRASV